MRKEPFPIKNILDSLREDVQNGTITLSQAAEELHRAGWSNYIDEDTAQGYSYTSSIDSDVYNRIKLAWDNDETGVREVHVMNNTASQSKWGTLQYYEKLDNALNTADLQTKAKALMKYYNVIHRELTMQKVFGDVRARAGTSVCVGMGLGDINIKNYMCVEKAKHTFSNGLYTMDLYLSGIRGEFSA